VIRREAPAKLNLTLEVIGRREDGYHRLDSLVAFTEYGDTIEVEAADDLSLAIDGPFGAALGQDRTENLVLKAARRLAEAAGITPRAAIRLTKRLPLASGIGGGSSDAAATLSALTELWALTLPDSTFREIALALGADVPVCLARRPARLEGIGEVVTPVPALPPVPVVLVNPGIALPTPAVFQARTGAFSTGAGPDGVLAEPPADAAALAHALARHGNDLTEPAIRLKPVIAEVIAALEATSGRLLARMSGSGATCFALFTEAEQAERAAARVLQARPGWWAVATRLSG
jgi:4-diphosphocytidyl-2-C-methyl-D-erythritol kinase